MILLYILLAVLYILAGYIIWGFVYAQKYKKYLDHTGASYFESLAYIILWPIMLLFMLHEFFSDSIVSYVRKRLSKEKQNVS